MSLLERVHCTVNKNLQQHFFKKQTSTNFNVSTPPNAIWCIFETFVIIGLNYWAIRKLSLFNRIRGQLRLQRRRPGSITAEQSSDQRQRRHSTWLQQ